MVEVTPLVSWLPPKDMTTPLHLNLAAPLVPVLLRIRTNLPFREETNSSFTCLFAVPFAPDIFTRRERTCFCLIWRQCETEKGGNVSPAPIAAVSRCHGQRCCYPSFAVFFPPSFFPLYMVDCFSPSDMLLLFSFSFSLFYSRFFLTSHEIPLSLQSNQCMSKSWKRRKVYIIFHTPSSVSKLAS